jgi:hypothetical protein
LPDDENTDAFGGWVWISARSLSYKDVMNALVRGDLYAACGPEIKSLIVEDEVVKIEFSDCVRANLITNGRRTDFAAARQGETLNYAEFPLRESDGYFRITVTDERGKKAWSQVYEI